MGALATELLHEVVEDDLHQPVLLLLDRVYRDVSEEDGVGPHPQVVLHLALHDLVARPAVLDDPAKPGVLDHRNLVGNPPQFGDERIRREWHISE